MGGRLSSPSMFCSLSARCTSSRSSCDLADPTGKITDVFSPGSRLEPCSGQEVHATATIRHPHTLTGQRLAAVQPFLPVDSRNMHKELASAIRGVLQQHGQDLCCKAASFAIEAAAADTLRHLVPQLQVRTMQRRKKSSGVLPFQQWQRLVHGSTSHASEPRLDKAAWKVVTQHSLLGIDAGAGWRAEA
jgi:hypothetical protein